MSSFPVSIWFPVFLCISFNFWTCSSSWCHGHCCSCKSVLSRNQLSVLPSSLCFSTLLFLSLPGSLVVDCGHPGSPPNGVLSGDKFTFGSTVRYSCLGGRQLKGESSRTCQLNGMWSAPMPFCSGNHFNLYWIYRLLSPPYQEQRKIYRSYKWKGRRPKHGNSTECGAVHAFTSCRCSFLTLLHLVGGKMWMERQGWFCSMRREYVTICLLKELWSITSPYNHIHTHLSPGPLTIHHFCNNFCFSYLIVISFLNLFKVFFSVNFRLSSCDDCF